MKYQKARARLCRSLSEAGNQATADGLDYFDFVNALIGAVAATVEASGHTEQDTVELFRMFANVFEEEISSSNVRA